MQEFTSISVSSYDAASLADKLTEKSSTGWDVVAIVPAGTNITAYLSRAADATETAPTWDTGSEDAAADDDDAAAPVSDAGATGVITTATDADEAVEEPAPVWEPEPVAEEPTPVEEPAGWAVAPEPASPQTASTGVAEASPEPAPYEPSSDYSAGQPAAAAEPEYTGEPRLGSTTAGYDTGTTGHDSPTPGYETGVSSGTATDPSSYDAGATTEPTSSYDAGATTEPTSSYDAGATTEPSTGYETAGRPTPPPVPVTTPG